MQIFGGSDANHDGGFLHAGYLSGSPRSYDEYLKYDSKLSPQDLQVVGLEKSAMDEGGVLDVAAALELADSDRDYAGSLVVESTTEESVASYNQYGESTYAFQHYSDNAPSISTLGVCCFCFAFIGTALLFLYRKKLTKTVTATATIIVFTTFFIALTNVLLFFVALARIDARDARSGVKTVFSPPPVGVVEPLPEPDRICSYKNPYAASVAVMHSIIAPAMTGVSPGEMESMAGLRHEIGLPLLSERMTPGMRYALTNYDRDGWGAAFRMELTLESYELTSAGEDGRFTTSDDIVLTCPRLDVCDHFNWEPSVCGFFYDASSESLYVHRVAHPMFHKRRPEEARSSTDGELYDLIIEDTDDPYLEKINSLPTTGELLFIGML